MKVADSRREAALYDIRHDAHRGHASFAARHWKRLTLEAHLIKLARECRASERDGLWRPSQP